MAVGSVGKRKSERKGCSVKAQILLADRDPIDCIVVDFSGTGARVHLTAPIDLPPRFKLFIPSRPETKRVLLRWIRGDEIGLEYSTGVADENSVFELAERVERLEAAAGTTPGIESRIAELEERSAALAEGGAQVGDPALEPAALDRKIEKIARTAEDQARRVEQYLVSRMDQTEERLRIAFAPDMGDRLARLEALAEAGAFERKAAAVDVAPTPAPESAVVRRIADLEEKIAAIVGAGSTDGAGQAGDPAFEPAALGRKIDKVARTAEDQAYRVEQLLVARMDQTEERLRTALAPDIVDRLGRLEALAESGAFEQKAATVDVAPPPAPDSALVRRIADLEAKMMAVRPPVAPAAPDLSGVHARIDEVALEAEEYAARVERFVNARIDDVEAGLISSPSPSAVRDSQVAEFEFQVRELAARLEQNVAPSSVDHLTERVSDLEMSLMEVRTEAPASLATGADEALLAQIARIEERNGEIMGALRNVLALLSARDNRRAAG